MTSETKNPYQTIISPLTGHTQPLDQVPDDVFSKGIFGDGIAIVPTAGQLLSPVTGTVTTVSATRHAYTFASDDGLELLVHIGIDSIALKGEGFVSHVSPGDRVTAGQKVAEFDLELMDRHGIRTVTPVILCDGGDDLPLHTAEGPVSAGRSPLISLGAPLPESLPEAPPAPKKKLDFDFLQKLGKVLMSVIAVMPAAGMMLSLGKLLQMAQPELLVTLGAVMESIGWAVITNLHLLFAAAIGGSWAKDRSGGAFAAVLSFILINRITGAVFGVTTEMLSDPNAVVCGLFGSEMAVSHYFVDILGAPALDMGVFAGIIAGFVGGGVYNKYYNFRALPEALDFFNGKRFVPLAVMFCSALVSGLVVLVWPLVQQGINAFGLWIADSASTAPLLAPFLYGTLERLLLPFGLHHMLTIPMNYTAFGGEYMIQTGVNAGSMVYGQDPLWLAWVTDLCNLRSSGDAAAYSALLTGITPGRFKVGQMIGATGLLPGIGLAMYRNVDPDKRRRYRSMFFSATLAVLLTGVTEPLEFLFMFCALPLYVVYAVLQGCSFAMAGVMDLRLHAFGNLEFATRIPMSLKAGLGSDIANFLICCAVYLAIGYLVAYAMIRRFSYATPGRLGNYQEETGSAALTAKNRAQAEAIIALLGGRENILLVDACMTRLRITVRDPALVAPPESWKAQGALELIHKGTGVQAVYGSRADLLKSDINDIL